MDKCSGLLGVTPLLRGIQSPELHIIRRNEIERTLPQGLLFSRRPPSLSLCQTCIVPWRTQEHRESGKKCVLFAARDCASYAGNRPSSVFKLYKEESLPIALDAVEGSW